MRGRKPIPTLLKLVSATQRKHRANPAEPQPAGELLAPPEQMTDAQKEVWRYAIGNAPKGLLRFLDRDLFASWVMAVAEINLAEASLATEGPVVKKGGDQRITINPDGTQVKTVRSATMVPSPWTRIRNEAFQRMVKATSELGFSPTSRSRITLAGANAKEANRFSNNAAPKRA